MHGHVLVNSAYAEGKSGTPPNPQALSLKSAALPYLNPFPLVSSRGRNGQRVQRADGRDLPGIVDDVTVCAQPTAVSFGCSCGMIL